MTRQTQILSGNFAGEKSKGNFSGYNAKGERIFIHKKAMENLGWKADKDVKYPFFAVVGEKEITTTDENGDLTNPPVLTKRLQALSVFTKREDLLNAVNADALLEIEAKGALVSSAKAAGLTEASLRQLVEASI